MHLMSVLLYAAKQSYVRLNQSFLIEHQGSFFLTLLSFNLHVCVCTRDRRICEPAAVYLLDLSCNSVKHL